MNQIALLLAHNRDSGGIVIGPYTSPAHHLAPSSSRK